MHTRADTHTHEHTHTDTHKHTNKHKHKHTHTNTHTQTHTHTNTQTQTRIKTPVPRSLAPYPEKASTVTNYVRFNPQCIHMLSRALAAAPPAPPCHICTVAPCLVADSGRQCSAAGRRGRSPCPHRHCAVRFSQPIHCLN